MGELRVTRQALPQVQEASTAVQMGDNTAAGKAVTQVGQQIMQTATQAGAYFNELEKKKQASDDWKADTDMRLKFGMTTQEIATNNANTKDKDEWMLNFDEAFKDFGADEYSKMSPASAAKVKAENDLRIQKERAKWRTKYDVQDAKEKTDSFNTIVGQQVASGDWESIAEEVRAAADNNVIFESDVASITIEKTREAKYQNIVNVTNGDPVEAMRILGDKDDPRISDLTPKQIDSLNSNARAKQNELNAITSEKVKAIQVNENATDAERESAIEDIMSVSDYHELNIPEAVMTDALQARIGKRSSAIDHEAVFRVKNKWDSLDLDDPELEEKIDKLKLDHILSYPNMGTKGKEEADKAQKRFEKSRESGAIKTQNAKLSTVSKQAEEMLLNGRFGDLYDYDPETRVVGTEKGMLGKIVGKFGVDWTRDVTVDRERELMTPDSALGYGKGFDKASEAYQNAAKQRNEVMYEIEEWYSKPENKGASQRELSDQFNVITTRYRTGDYLSAFGGSDLGNDVNPDGISDEEWNKVIGEFQ